MDGQIRAIRDVNRVQPELKSRSRAFQSKSQAADRFHTSGQDCSGSDQDGTAAGHHGGDHNRFDRVAGMGDSGAYGMKKPDFDFATSRQDVGPQRGRKEKEESETRRVHPM
jgi:hypothetical protein